MDSPGFRDRLVEAELDVVALSAVFSHAVGLTKAGMDIGAGSSFIKLVGTQTVQRIADLMLEAAGAHGAAKGPIETPDGPVDVSGFWRQARRLTIFAGTSQIQKNVTAKRVLGLP